MTNKTTKAKSPYHPGCKRVVEPLPQKGIKAFAPPSVFNEFCRGCLGRLDKPVAETSGPDWMQQIINKEGAFPFMTNTTTAIEQIEAHRIYGNHHQDSRLFDMIDEFIEDKSHPRSEKIRALNVMHKAMGIEPATEDEEFDFDF